MLFLLHVMLITETIMFLPTRSPWAQRHKWPGSEGLPQQDGSYQQRKDAKDRDNDVHGVAAGQLLPTARVDSRHNHHGVQRPASWPESHYPFWPVSGEFSLNNIIKTLSSVWFCINIKYLVKSEYQCDNSDWTLSFDIPALWSSSTHTFCIANELRKTVCLTVLQQTIPLCLSSKTSHVTPPAHAHAS